MAEPTKQRVPTLTDTVTGAIAGFDDLADAIANPTPTQPLRNAVGASGRNYCNYLGSVPGAASDLLGPGFTVGALLCAPYWEKNNYDAPVESAPFTGGQCNEQYQVRAGGSAEVFSCSSGASLGTRTRAMGDVGVPRQGPITRVALVAQTPTLCGFNNYALEIEGPNIGIVVSGNFFSPGSGNSARMGGATLTVELVPIDGVDDCGDPPDTYTPGPNAPPEPPAFPTGQEPGVDPDGQPFFFVPPVDSPIPFSDPIAVPPLAPDPTGGGGGDNPGEPEEGTPEETGEGGEDEGEAPEGKELWALKIVLTTIPPSARLYAPGVYRGVCYVYMGDENGLDHDPAGAMLRSGQLVLAEREGLTRWRVAANVGYNLTVTPYYRTPRSES